jgi:DNA-binding transcriptional LysR family regulator
MEMQQVRYFLGVARTLNFTRAAEECNVTQPALTRAIKQLEDELGGELIRREGRNTHLTDLGKRMQPLLQQCYDSAQMAKTLAAKVKKGEVASLSLGVSRSLDLELIMAPLDEMRRSFPGIKLKVRRGSGAEIGELLKTGDIDLALGGPVGVTWDRLEVWPMFTETFDFVVGSSHELAQRNEFEIDVELVRHEQLLIQSGMDMAELQPGGLDDAGIIFDNAHEVESVRDLEALVVAQFGVALLPATTMQNARVRHLNCSAIDLRRTVAIYSAAGRPRSRESASLLNLVRSSDWSSVLGVYQLDSVH